MSRGRKGRKNKPRPVGRFRPPAGRPECDCPACSGAELTDGQLTGDIVARLAECDDPMEAELASAAFLAVGAPASEVFDVLLAGRLVPDIEARASADALAALLALGSVAPGPVRAAATAAAGRLTDAGIERPGWAPVLSEPLEVVACRRYQSPAGDVSTLGCTFRRAGQPHTFLVVVDHTDCDAAAGIALTDDAEPPAMITLPGIGRRPGAVVAAVELEPAELRWQIEGALAARAVHDAEEADEWAPGRGADDLEYTALAVLLRSRLAVLPVPDRPPAAHGDSGPLGSGGPDWLALPAGLTGLLERGRDTPLPAPRTPAAGPAPVYRLTVTLRGSRPPIWRRLEVPADITLDRLHTIVQVAFGWDDSHLHVFDTPYGRFGSGTEDLGHQPETAVTLGQVAPGQGGKLSYTYDFGDGWEHDVLVEKVYDAEATVTYPRCTGGRRAAPPEDCGGIWGYTDLVDILGDPAHPEHEERLEWLGLDTATDFDPAAFDPAAVTERLAAVRR